MTWPTTYLLGGNSSLMTSSCSWRALGRHCRAFQTTVGLETLLWDVVAPLGHCVGITWALHAHSRHCISADMGLWIRAQTAHAPAGGITIAWALWKRSQTRVWVAADIQGSALHVHCVSRMPYTGSVTTARFPDTETCRCIGATVSTDSAVCVCTSVSATVLLALVGAGDLWAILKQHLCWRGHHCCLGIVEEAQN